MDIIEIVYKTPENIRNAKKKYAKKITRFY